MANLLVFIGARGGSKGVKGKNIRSLSGKPLIVYTIQQALAWGKAKRVIVSTDSQDIADVAKDAGAEVPFLRPAELAHDTASKGKAIKHAFLKCEELFGEQYDAVIDLDVTAPIRTVEDIDNAWQIFQEQKALTLFSVVKAHKNPYFNMVEEREDGEVCLSKPLGRINRRQDAPAVYAMNASIYFYSREHICGNEDPAPFSSRTRMYVMDDIAGVDIDREVDFKFIEFLIKEKIVAI